MENSWKATLCSKRRHIGRAYKLIYIETIDFFPSLFAVMPLGIVHRGVFDRNARRYSQSSIFGLYQPKSASV